MDNILTATTIIVPIIMAVTGLVKTVVKDNKWLPILNVGVGIGIGTLYAISIVKGDLAIYAWAGAIAGLTAGGFYDLGANGKAIVNQNTSANLIKDGKGEKDTREGD